VSSPRWSDDELLQELRIALQDQPADEDVIRAAREAFTWRLDDAEIELLTLAADYSLEAGRDAGAGVGTQVRGGERPRADAGLVGGAQVSAADVRGAGPFGPQTLVFHGERMSVEIEIDETGIVGQLIPPRPGQVTLVTPDGPQATTQADEVGCFSLPSPGPGPLRLDCQLADCRFITEWATA
jgi:hypothetical protein